MPSRVRRSARSSPRAEHRAGSARRPAALLLGWVNEMVISAREDGTALDTRVGLEDTTRLPGGATADGNAQLVHAALTRVAETRSSRATATDADSND